MMKILSIAWKDTLLRFADRAEILFFLVLPVVFTFLLSGGASQADSQDNGQTVIPLLVVDEDQSDLSQELVAALKSSETVQASLVSRDEAVRQFDLRMVQAWAAVPHGFEAALLNGEPAALELSKQPNNTNADAAERALHTAAGQVNRSLSVAQASLAAAEQARPFATASERTAYLEASLESARQVFAASPARLVASQPVVMQTEPGYDQASQASIGQVLTWVFIPLLGASGIFASERRTKTLARLFTTATSRSTFLLGTVTGQLGIALVQMALLIGFGSWMLKVQWGRSPAGLVAMSLAFALSSVAFGVMLGSFVKTEKQASNLSIALGMVMALLSGCWWPMELFPNFMRILSKILPLTWAMQGFNDLVTRGRDLASILPSVGMLLGFAIVFFVVGVRRFKFE